MGSYSLGISNDGGKVVPIADPVLVSHETKVSAEYHSHWGRRWAGVALLVASALTGGLMLLASESPTCPSDGPCDQSTSPALPAAMIVLSVGIVAGIFVLATSSDSASAVQR